VATVDEIALSQVGICASVPSVGDGVCSVCHGCPGTGFQTCWSCHQVSGQLSKPCSLVVPISLYEIPSQLHHLLRHYKSGKYPRHQEDFSVRVVSLLAYFLATHGTCISKRGGGEWDVVTSVPSSRPRVGEHPLVTSIRRVKLLGERFEMLLQLGTGQVGHLNASDDGFAVTRSVSGKRVLLIDDTFTTGATAQSAASALALGGATVVAIVAIGRVINPSFNEMVEGYWKRQRAVPFTFDRCCLE
jgi:hypothetical protein